MSPLSSNSGSVARALALLALGMFALLLPLLFAFGIPGSSEAREAHVASEIVQNGNWILPTRNGLVPSKPLFFHWQAALVSLSLGLKTVPIELVRALSLFYCCATAFLCGVFSYRLNKNVQQAQFALLSVLSTYGFLSQGFSAMVDMSFCFWLWLALFPLITPLIEGQIPSNKQRSLFFVICAAAVLTKGPLGLALACLMAGIFECSLRGLVPTLRNWIKPNLGWLILPGIVLPWYLASNSASSGALLERQFLFENVARLVGDDNIRSETPWFYFPSLVRFGAPWSLLLVWLVIRSRIRGLTKYERGFLFTLVGTMLALSVSAGKRHTYLLPLYPLLSIVLASAATRYISAARILQRESLPKILLACLWGAVLIAALLSVFAGATTQSFVRQASIPIFITLGLLFLWTRQYAVPWLSNLKVLCTLLGLTLCCTFGLKAAFKQYDSFAQSVREIVKNRPLACIRSRYDELFDPVLYRLHRPSQLVPPDEAPPGDAYLLVRREWQLTHSQWVISRRQIQEAAFGGVLLSPAQEMTPVESAPSNTPSEIKP